MIPLDKLDGRRFQNHIGKFGFKEILLDHVCIANGNGSAEESPGDAAVRKIIDNLT